MTMLVTLTSGEIGYLTTKTLVPPDLSEQLKSVSTTEGIPIAFSISEEEADILRDLLGQELQRHGFDNNYNPTPEGRMLENLIDKLFVG
jgi:hypothetical protein